MKSGGNFDITYKYICSLLFAHHARKFEERNTAYLGDDLEIHHIDIVPCASAAELTAALAAELANLQRPEKMEGSFSAISKLILQEDT